MTREELLSLAEIRQALGQLSSTRPMTIANGALRIEMERCGLVRSEEYGGTGRYVSFLTERGEDAALRSRAASMGDGE